MIEIHFLLGLVIASIFVLGIAMYYCFKLYKETENEKFWLMLTIGFTIISIHTILELYSYFGSFFKGYHEIVEWILLLIGSIFILYAIHGLYTTFIKINKKTK